MLNFEGRGLLGKVGVDARIFKALSDKNINVSIISQGSSERGIGLIIEAERAHETVFSLEKEFEDESEGDDKKEENHAWQDKQDKRHILCDPVKNKC